MNAAQFADWMPVRLYWEGDHPMVDWCYLGASRFTEPFFADTIEKCFYTPFNLLFRKQTSIDALAELEQVAPGVPPSGFVFHMSRCGSTLVSQMLAALPQNIVISEAIPIDMALRSNFFHPEVTDEQRVKWLRGVVSALARPRAGKEKYFFCKLDCWHILELPLIARAFPGVPWIFLYRNPVEVIVSHHGQRGTQMVPGMLAPNWLGLGAPDLMAVSLEDYAARVLARLCEAALQFRDASSLFVNYRQLPDAVWSRIAEHFRVEFSPADIERMREVAQFHAKSPWERFAEDTTTKNRAAADWMRELAAQYLDPLYAKLESNVS